jgi:hypothetical protein
LINVGTTIVKSVSTFLCTCPCANLFSAGVALSVVLMTTSIGLAQEPASKAAAPPPEETSSSPQRDATADHMARIAKLKSQLSGSVFAGRFSDDSQEGNELREERYEILSAMKLPTGNMWLIKTRIKYGDHDITVPIPLPIQWAGSTPVITLDQLTIPGLGTFDARVVISGDRYAGTWQHGDHGGHLFGRIEKAGQ